MKTRITNTLLLLATTFCFQATIIQATVKAAPPAAPPVVVTLTVEKKATQADKNGQPLWQPIGQPGTVVLPGDILRFTVKGSSHLAHPIKGFVLTQPIPRGTEYLPLSASAVPGTAQITASIDKGKTYAETPTIKVPHPDGTTTDEPAPASRYTNLRWTFPADLPALASASAQCEVRVR